MKEKKRNRPSVGILLFFLVVLLCGNHGFCVQAGSEEGRVLFISSYSFAWTQTQLQMSGIRAGLGEDVILDYEFMDTKRVDDDRALELFYEGLSYRLSQVEAYDAVILGDDAALKFALRYQEELFAGIPMFFEGVSGEDLIADAEENPLITGVVETLPLEENIELGLKITPDAKKVIAILDDSITGEAERKRFYRYAEKYPELEFGEINTSQLKTFSLRYALSSLPEDTILIYIVMTEDADGRLYTNRQSVQLIGECAGVPALRMVEGEVGQGVLGGCAVSMYKSGELAARMAMDVMSGTPVESSDIVWESPEIYCIDAAVMEEFDISLSVLPEGTELVNRKNNFFERNREALLPGGLIVAGLVLVIIWFVVDNNKRRTLLKELEAARKIMETASQHDFLTGIPNRNKFMSDLNQLVEKKVPCTVIMIDIDDFKVINDTLGHTAGDEALTQVAARLREMESQILTPYRFAGDEFILILQSSQGKIVEKTAYQCRQVFTSPFVLSGGETKVCGSIGIASYPKDTEDVEQLIICADNAMYHVKRSGKNDFAYYKK
ncbi:MAG: diguanylate cyclase [Lachnospiraceae bacterium]|nr:diguanylate cyclase [Lachnospiraceae bacterium]